MSRFAPGAFKGSTFSLALAGLVIRALGRARAALKSRIEVARLTDLDDRALKDIGLMRTDVYAALAMPLHRDPSLHLVDVAGHKREAASAGPQRPADGLPRDVIRLRGRSAPVTGRTAAC